MICKPILFNTDMVRAILAGQKTQTRRLVKQKYNNTRLAMRTDKYGTRLVEEEKLIEGVHTVRNSDGTTTLKLRAIEDVRPPYKRGDILWVRETWSTTDKCGLYPNWPTDGIHYIYKADDPTCDAAKESRWYPSIHMPKQAARIFLRVKEVRVELLQDIKADGISAEEITSIAATCGDMEIALVEWKNLWNSTIKKADLQKYGWDSNPWVWVIEFERCEKPEGWDKK